MKRILRMQFEDPSGKIYKGAINHNIWFKKLGFSNIYFKNKNVLDIATDEGWWAFKSEMLGAKNIEAWDIELGEKYDWGFSVDKNWCEKLNKTRTSKEVFDWHHKRLNSKVFYRNNSIYDLKDNKNNFDLIFCHGLFYHLRHPLLAIDLVRKSCSNLFCFETHVDLNSSKYLSASKFYRTTEHLDTISNWTGATIGCYASWLKDAGFNHIFYSNWGTYPSHRRIFIALVNDEHLEVLKMNKNLSYCDNKFFEKVFKKTYYNENSIIGKLKAKAIHRRKTIFNRLLSKLRLIFTKSKS